MIEHDFTQLDDDFITFWSRFLTANDQVDFHKELKYFARKGQINAVQNWYLYNPVGEDPSIDKIVENYKGKNFNEIYAAANYFFMREDLYKKFCDLSEEYTDLFELLNHDKFDDEDYDEDEKDFDEFEDDFSDIDPEEIKQDMEEIKNKVHNMPHVKMINLAYKTALKYAKENSNYLAFSTANEILDCLPQMLPIYEDTNEIEKKVMKNNSSIVKILMDMYKKSMEKDKDFNPTKNPALSFCLANSILAFEKESENAGFAYYLLEELAGREYTTKSTYGFNI